MRFVSLWYTSENILLVCELISILLFQRFAVTNSEKTILRRSDFFQRSAYALHTSSVKRPYYFSRNAKSCVYSTPALPLLRGRWVAGEGSLLCPRGLRRKERLGSSAVVQLGCIPSSPRVLIRCVRVSASYT